MIACNNCGQQNDSSSLICRYCGTSLSPSRQPVEQRDYVPPPPHIWATDAPPAPVQPVGNYQPPAGYRCPRCASTHPPLVASRVSSDGWLVLVLLLFFCAPLFWIGLLMKQEYRICSVCRANLS